MAHGSLHLYIPRCEHDRLLALAQPALRTGNLFARHPEPRSGTEPVLRRAGSDRPRAGRARRSLHRPHTRCRRRGAVLVRQPVCPRVPTVLEESRRHTGHALLPHHLRPVLPGILRRQGTAHRRSDERRARELSRSRGARGLHSRRCDAAKTRRLRRAGRSPRGHIPHRVRRRVCPGTVAQGARSAASSRRSELPVVFEPRRSGAAAHGAGGIRQWCESPAASTGCGR